MTLAVARCRTRASGKAERVGGDEGAAGGECQQPVLHHHLAGQGAEHQEPVQAPGELTDGGRPVVRPERPARGQRRVGLGARLGEAGAAAGVQEPGDVPGACGDPRPDAVVGRCEQPIECQDESGVTRRALGAVGLVGPVGDQDVDISQYVRLLT